MPALLAVLKSRHFITTVGVVVCIILLGQAISKIYDIGYAAGKSEQQAIYETAQAQRLTQDIDALILAQKDTLSRFLQDQQYAAEAREREQARQAQLIDSLARLSDVQETECIRVATATLRLLNQPACEYNRKRGLNSSDPSGTCAPLAEPPGGDD